jgi:hypothetical protein
MELLSKSEIAREKNENATHVCCVRLSIYGPQNQKKRHRKSILWTPINAY